MKDTRKVEEELLIKYTLAVEQIAQFQNTISELRLTEGFARQKDDRFKALVTASSDVIYRMNPDWSDMYQLQNNGILRNIPGSDSKWLQGYIPPDDQPFVLAAINKAILTKGIFELEHRAYKANGSIGWTHSRAVPILDKDGEILEWLGVAHDITERKEAERFRDGLNEIGTLVQSTLSFDEIMNKVIVDASKILGVDSAGISLRRGNRWLVSYIYNLPKEILWKKMTDKEEPHSVLAVKTKKPVVVNDAFHDERVNVKHMKKWNVRSVMVVPLITPDEVVGVIFFNYQSKTFTFSENHVEFGTKLASTVSLAIRNSRLFEEVQEELAERKQIEEILREKEAQLQIIANETPVLLTQISRDLRYLFVNHACAEMLGRKPEEIVGKPMVEIIGKEALETIRPYFERALQGERVEYESEIHYQNAGPRFMHVTYIPERNEQGEVVGWIASISDITERKKAEEELRTYREGLEELVHERTLELEEKNRALNEEITERKRIEKEKQQVEAQLLQAQKIESLGSLAGGIAHSLNNLLFPVLLNLEALLDGAEPGTQDHEMLSQTMDSVNSQADLIKQILSFSRQNVQNKSQIKMGTLLESTLGLIRSILPSTIEIRHSTKALNDTILGDPTQIQQVIMNLCKNAADAMEGQKGTIDVSLSDIHVERRSTKLGIIPGKYLKLTVQDTGQGIPHTIMERIFDPFFTTKPVGKGTGMGLSVVHGIARSHKGTVTVRSKVGEGSRFMIYLPVHDPESITGETIVQNQGTTRKKILLVDDEEKITSTLKRILRKMEYDVITQNDARDALDTFLMNPESFDLVITDLTMPGMTGIELGEKIMETHPDIPIILCTGFSETVSHQELKEKGFSGLIPKPARIKELKDAISKAMKIS